MKKNFHLLACKVAVFWVSFKFLFSLEPQCIAALRLEPQCIAALRLEPQCIAALRVASAH